MEKKEFDKCEGNVKKQWNIAKNKMFNNKNLTIERIIQNDQMVIGSKKVSAAFNRFFIQKVRKIRNSLENKTEDPMASFKKYIKTPSKKLHFTQIKMSQLKEVFKKMKKLYLSLIR